MTNKKALILGATGMVGTQLVKELGNSKIYSEIHLLTRRAMKLADPKCIGHVLDFDNLSSSKSPMCSFVWVQRSKRLNRRKLFVKWIMTM
ncbi:NAD-dependent epimerase/dehydratase family protein [Peribacillus frigoritolerans]|uniref:NAD-dependent epimerase/dehydratase family protein n=1 Tax=Peribacillus frigoritolerans TaxID=450367 RepID=UPI0032B3312E